MVTWLMSGRVQLQALPPVERMAFPQEMLVLSTQSVTTPFKGLQPDTISGSPQVV